MCENLSAGVPCHAARDAHHDEPSPVFSQRLRWSGPAVGLGGLEPPTSSFRLNAVTAVRTAVPAGRFRPSGPKVCVQPTHWYGYAFSAKRIGLAWPPPKRTFRNLGLAGWCDDPGP